MEGTRLLQSVHLMEKDYNGDVFCTWSFPDVEPEWEQVMIARSDLENEPPQYSYSRYKANWLYIFTQPVSPDSKVISFDKVKAYSIALMTNDFNPEKYYVLAKLFSSLYSTHGDVLKLLEGFVSVFAKGNFNGGELGVFQSAEFNNNEALLTTSLSDIVKAFGEEIILLWSAIMCKKRIAVYSEKIMPLLRIIRAIPLLAFHRGPSAWTQLRPFTKINDLEMKELKSAGIYIAGFTDPRIQDLESTYDLLVDITKKSIIVPSHAKAEFPMTSIHKDVCTYLLTSAENEELAQEDMIKGLVVKTKELLGKLESLKTTNAEGESYIEIGTLENANIPAKLIKFLYGVAAAEGMSKSA